MQCFAQFKLFLQAPEERKRIKLLLAAQEQLFPDVHGNLLQVRWRTEKTCVFPNDSI
jgi:hypothetical protein